MERRIGILGVATPPHRAREARQDSPAHGQRTSGYCVDTT